MKAKLKNIKTVSIRDMNMDLWWKAKSLASSRQMTIKQLILDLLRQAVKEEK